MKDRVAGVQSSRASQSPLTSAEVERLLNAWQTSQRAEGLEARVLERLDLEHSLRTASSDSRLPQTFVRTAWSRTGIIAPVAASLLCVLTGGFLVARETARQAQHLPSIALRSLKHTTSLTINSPAGGSSAAVGPGLPALATASARSKPMRLIPAGRRRGRASATPGSIPK